MPIALQPVSSSNIAALGYGADSEVLHIQFHGGALWEFTQITPEMHASLVNAPSIGGYFQRFIRGRFNGRKLAGAAPAKTDETLARSLREMEVMARTVGDAVRNALDCPCPHSPLTAMCACSESCPTRCLV